MKYYLTMPAQLLSLPFVVSALVCLYFAWEVDEGYAIYMVPFVVLLAIIYVFSPQINWWWYTRNTPKLDPRLTILLQQRMPFYQQLTLEAKKQFRDRIFLYMHANEFTPQGTDSVPEDIKLVIAASAVQLTFGQEDFLLAPFEKIIIYPKPFPSPQYPRHFHASEIYEEDGVILFSAEQLMLGFMQPNQYYNIALHEYAKVFRVNYPEKDYPKLPEDIWEKLEQISHFSRKAVTEWINLEVLPPYPVSVSHFFIFPQAFQAHLPEVYERYVKVFGQDPLRAA
ncbi:MAG: zinc-dependent peptidase [Bacteroidota bacterium]